jgi:exodeoxyribonuclease VII large subunit
VISAVGHETDFTIADFVADLRAPTPSAAAEMAVPPRQDLIDRIERARRAAAQQLLYRLGRLARRLESLAVERALGGLRRAIGRHAQRVDELEFASRERVRQRVQALERRRRALEARLRRFDIRPRLAEARRRQDASQAAAVQAMRNALARRRAALDRLSTQLVERSPLTILERGYAIVSGPAGVLKEAAPEGTPLHIRLARGEMSALAQETRKHPIE